MRFLLLSLFSREDNSSALAVYDLEKSETLYIQMIDFHQLPGRVCHIRGMSWLDDKLFVASSFCLFRFGLEFQNGKPCFRLEKQIVQPEWIYGAGAQANIHDVCTLAPDQIYTFFNAQGALDKFDYKGNLLKRKYLWEIAPDEFLTPESVDLGRLFRFGMVRSMFRDGVYGLVLVAAYDQGEFRGALISANTGEVIFRTPYSPHSSLIYNNKIYLTDIKNGIVYAYKWPSGIHNKDFFRYDSMYRLPPNKSILGSNVRGMLVGKERVVCGFFHDTSRYNPSSAKLVEFDLRSSEFVNEHSLPDFEGLQKAQVYAISSIPGEITDKIATWNKPKIFFQEKEVVPRFSKDYFPDKREESSSKDYSNTKISNDSPCRESVLLHDVSICFVRKARSMFGRNKQLRQSRKFWALKNISFVLNEGETVGVIGRNGSGKSTLSLVCAGVYKPDTGFIQVHGKVQLLALGVGFKPELTGLENVYVSASLLGLSRSEIDGLLPEIESFAGLGDFIHEPIRTYSSGMRSKLGFAVATAVEPDVLILDEAMSVGDKAFKDKAVARMKEMRNKAKSVLIVSHSSSELKKLCSRVIWMERGRILMDDDADVVLENYDEFCKNPTSWYQRNPEYLFAEI